MFFKKKEGMLFPYIKRKEQFFLMMVGLSGSGKTTLAQTIGKQYKAKVLSSDEYRKTLFGDPLYQGNNQLVFEKMHKDVISLLKEGKSVIYDATNLTIKNRSEILRRVKRIKDVKIACYIKVNDINCCMSRNLQRSSPIPSEAIVHQMQRFQIPFKEEGFDKIFIEGFSAESCKKNFTFWNDNRFMLIDLLKDHNQNSRYHKHSLLIHSMLAYENLKGTPPALRTAALFHDIGKLFTQSQHEDGNCSYLNHENVGTYNLLQNLEDLHLRTEQEVLDCLFYINYHMMPFNLTHTKTKEKYQKIWGKEKFNNLWLLHEADKKACE